jgi:hypothetical protein
LAAAEALGAGDDALTRAAPVRPAVAWAGAAGPAGGASGADSPVGVKTIRPAAAAFAGVAGAVAGAPFAADGAADALAAVCGSSWVVGAAASN